LLKRIQVAGPDAFVKRPVLQNGRWQKKLVGKFLPPLLSEIGWRNNQNPPFLFSPFLCDEQTSLDGLAESDLVGQDRTTGKRVAKCE